MRQAPDENGGEIKGSTIFLKKEERCGINNRNL
jgi:hypothetical protein